MYYLYGLKSTARPKLVATFDSDAQLLSYISWATLRINPDATRAFEQGTPLVGYNRFDAASHPLTDDDEASVVHNPTPSML